MSILVRAPEPSEVELWADLVLELYRDDPGPVPFTRDRARAQFARLCDPANRVWPLLITQDGAALGYAILVAFYSNEFGGDIVTLDEFFIRSAYRGQGLGAEFLAGLRRYAERTRLPRVELFVNDGNRAQKLYERAGFEVAKRRLWAWSLAEPTVEDRGPALPPRQDDFAG